MIKWIKSRLKSDFHPFTLKLSGGKKFHVPHRNFIAVHPKLIVVIDPKGVSHTINPLHVASIDEVARRY